MKNWIIYLTAVLAAGTLGSCKQDIPYSNTAAQGLNSVSAMFAEGPYKTDQNVVFTTMVDPTKEEIMIEVPWFWPVESTNETSIDKMRIMANLDANCTISPSFGGTHDLADEFHFTFTNKNGVKTRHYFKGVRKKLDLKAITEFKLDSPEIDGIINEDARTVTLVSADPLTDATASVGISPHAGIAPDPATPRSYETPVEFTVTAHDGTTAVWTVKKGVPNKLPAGYRVGSERLMWAKKLGADVGISTLHLTGGLAVTDQYVVLNTRNEASVYLNRMTGEKVGTISLGAAVTGSLVNFYNTADEAGNILINNLVTGSGDFKIWKLSSVTGTPELFLTYSTSVPLGRKISVKGSLDGNAIITSGVNSAGSTFARWKVTNGVLDSATPEFITISGGYTWSNNNVDVVHSSASDLTADYFVASYSANTTAWIGGTNNTLKARLTATSSNWIPNAIDHAVFNNTPYVVFNAINSFSWGASDQIVLAEASNAATFTSPAVDGGGNSVVGQAIKWVSPTGTYGGNQAGGVNTNGTGDVAFKMSADGYYLYVYFMFTNGYVVCYRFDCIEQ